MAQVGSTVRDQLKRKLIAILDNPRVEAVIDWFIR